MLVSIRPGDQRLPLLDVLLDAARRNVPYRQAVGGQLHVVLRVAQEAEHGEIEAFDEPLQLLRSAGSLIDAHPQHPDLSIRLQLAAVGKLGKESGGRVDIKE